MATIFCMHCGATMPEGTRFCPECGSPTLLEARLDEPEWEELRQQPVPCPACGALNAAGSRFCNGCGTLLVADDDADAEDANEGMQPIVPNVLRGESPRAVRMKTLASGLAVLALVAVFVLGASLALLVLGNRRVGDVPAPETGEVVTQETEETEAAPEVEVALGEVGSMGSAGTEVRATLSDYSWPELSIIGRQMTRLGNRDAAYGLAIEYHLADEAGNLSQDTKDVEIAGMGSVPMRLVGIYHDDLASGEGKAGLTFLAAEIALTHQVKDVDDNVGGWESSQLRAWLNEVVWSAMDQELAPMIVAVDKRTNNVGMTRSTTAVTSTLDNLWIPSVVEVCGAVSWDWDSDIDNSEAYNAVLNAEGEQYEAFARMGVSSVEANPGLALSASGEPASWWLRSCSASKDAHYRMVDAEGDPSRFGAAPDQLGVCLGFCL